MITLLQVPLVLGDSTIGAGFVSTALLFSLKLLFLLAGLLYLAFSVVVIRQIHIMQITLVTTLSPVLKLFGYLHFIAALAVLGYFIVVL